MYLRIFKIGIRITLFHETLFEKKDKGRTKIFSLKKKE